MSEMRRTLLSQPEQLERIVAAPGPAQAAAERLGGRRLLLVGVGTSWHAAHHGVWLLREAGVHARAAHAADLAPYRFAADSDDAVIVLSHTGTTGYSREVLDSARASGAETLLISGIGNGGELETTPPETSYAYTASHTGALLRLAQLAVALGAQLGLDGVPSVVGGVLDRPGPLLGDPPQRLVELIGMGPNGWTAQEGALKIREASYVASEGLSAEQFFHGPSVALDAQDALVVLDGGGPAADRLEAIAGATEATGARVLRFSERSLGEPLSVFALTAVVQRIALELAETRRVSPDRFRYEKDPRRQAAFEALRF